MLSNALKGLVLFTVLLTLSDIGVAQSKVELVNNDGRFTLLRNGEPFPIKGVGGTTQLGLLASCGGNSIRTWDTDDLGWLLDDAHKHGIAVCAGIWMGHQRHGFDYQKQDAVLKQLDEALKVVRQYKDHPALLMWGVGNEMEGEGGDPSVWYAVNHLAREIKRIDSDHPTMTVIAELGSDASKVKSIERFCPDVDIVGVNSYGGIRDVGERFTQAGGTKPYVITEHGTLGPWEGGKTSWGSPIEFTSTTKAKWYAEGYQANVQKHSENCLGTFAFMWGHKQETTATWFGMLLPDGQRLEAVDVMSELWTGTPPSNKAPSIVQLKLERTGKFAPGDSFKAKVLATDPEGRELKYKWVLRSDSGTIGEGGDPQEFESNIEDAVVAQGAQARVQLPKGGGGYRLFVYVYDKQGGAAVANEPIFVEAPIALTKVMPKSKLPYAIYSDALTNDTFIPSGYMGNAAAISMDPNCAEDPKTGATCLKAGYASSASWGGVLWQSPAGDWDGERPGGANLTGATSLEFWARGEAGGEEVNFVFGVLDGNQAYKDTAKGELKGVKLTSEWNRYTIPLKGLDLRQIKTGFGWSAAGQGKPIVFYLDDIRYIAE